MNKPTIVVVGGGAGGLELVTKLGRRLGRRQRANIVLVDRNATHIWKPLLHEVATGVLDSGVNEVSYQGHALNNGYHFQRGTLTNLDREAQRLTLAPVMDEGEEILPSRTLHYDHLVLAIGSVSNDFGTPGVTQFCHFLDSLQQAEGFRKDMLNTFLRYRSAEQDSGSQMTVGIIGAGATGIELAAELYEATGMLHTYGFTQLDSDHLNVHLIEASPTLLGMLPERIGNAVRKELEKLGVTIHLNTRVTEVTENSIITAEGDELKVDLAVWSAGIKAPDFLSKLGLSTERNNRIKVHDTLQSIDDENIFVLGDCASCPQGEDRTVPPRAQAAHQQASLLYTNLRAKLAGKPLKSFTFHDHGSLISLAHFEAIGNLMGGKSARSLFVEGHLARFFYASLYRMHQRAIFGTTRTGLIVLVDRLNRYLKPRLKLH
ncbi:NAD(P)/FAD-dependent oxidoreductase [Halomonas halocynthiae]|uniref:NAD(P)/FAD-dependent oxidoreductase n=1 Tax=Halomonas halocynthiae TaxID=176290 RepID=UPI000411850D|nr:NAD(P)/FAD-dependent oxidoreductase [Halomonas halocynthiae]